MDEFLTIRLTKSQAIALFDLIADADLGALGFTATEQTDLDAAGDAIAKRLDAEFPGWDHEEITA